MGSIGKTNSQDLSQSTSAQRTFVEPGQVPFLNALRGDAAQLAGQQLGQLPDVAGGLASSLGASGNVLLDSLLGLSGGGGTPGVGSSISALQGSVESPLAQQIGARAGAGGPGDAILRQLGQDTSLTDSLLGPNPGLQGSLSALDAAIQQNLASTTGTIAGQATLQGATGGSRQALATGLAGQEAGRQFAQGASQLIGQDFSNRQALAPALQAQQLGAQLSAAQGLNQSQQFGTSALSSLLGQDIGAQGVAGQLGLGQGQISGTAAQGGLGSLLDLFNLGISPFATSFAPLLAASEIFGTPNVLSEGVSQSTGNRVGSTNQLAIFSAGSAQSSGD